MLKRTLLLPLAFAAALATPAEAVYRDPGGLGQALIFPYYTTRSLDGNAFNTYVSIVNHTEATKALRVRFREGMNGREVAGFNLYLSGNDTWTGAVVPPSSASLPARVITADRSCVTGFTADASASLPFMNFGNASYSGSNGDGLGETLDRGREGYLEVIEMATIAGGAQVAALRPGSDGVTPPPDCGVSTVPAIPVAAPSGGISGTLTLINVNSGLDFTVNAEALADLAGSPFYRLASDPYPDFNIGEVRPVSHHAANGKIYRINWTNPALAVSAALTHRTLHNEVILDNVTQSATDWIVTFVTRRLHGTGVDASPFPSGTSRSLFFQLDFDARDGGRDSFVALCGVCPPRTYNVSPRFESIANVLSFRRGATASAAPGISSVLGSANGVVLTMPIAAQNGSASLTYDVPNAPLFNAQALDLSSGTTTTEAVRLEGLPGIGFAVRTFRNGTVPCAAGNCQGNYGGAFPHKSTVRVATP